MLWKSFLLLLVAEYCYGDAHIELGSKFMEATASGESAELDDPVCKNGTRQSPIDIRQCCDSDIPSLLWRGYKHRKGGFKMMNNGHTAEITLKGDESAFIRGGPLKGEYTFVNLHFHWGKSNNKGSEHTFKGKSGAIEAHFVHYKVVYGSIQEAIKHPDGISDIGVLFDLADKENKDLRPIIEKLSKITKSKSEVSLASDALPWVPEYFSHKKFATYEGSLTTSPCDEVVTWIVMKKRPTISAKQEFRKLLHSDGKPILENRREVQPLLSRKVYCSRC